MLLVVLRAPPPTASFFLAVAGACQLAVADVRQRMAGQGPWVLAVAADALALQAMIPPLERLGVRALLCDPAVVPTDEDRFLVRSLNFSASHLEVTNASGGFDSCSFDNVASLQSARRVQVTIHTTETTRRQFSLGKALLSGGILLTAKRTTSEKKAVQSDERFLLVARKDGGPDLMLYERRLDYRCLGKELQASSFANLEHVAARLHERSGVAVDDRLLAPGFITRLPKLGADPVDLGLYLMQLARMAE